MNKFDKSQAVPDSHYYVTALAQLVQEVETARWALYEIGNDTEAGRIIKKAICLLNPGLTADSVRQPDSAPLNDRLTALGFDRDLVDRVVAKLLSGRTNN